MLSHPQTLLPQRVSHSEISNEIKAKIIAITHNRAASTSAPGVSIKVYIANGMVCVSPGIFETKVIVAPPSERANANTVPTIIPGRESGMVIVKKTRNGVAPNVLAANSNFGQPLQALNGSHVPSVETQPRQTQAQPPPTKGKTKSKPVI